MAISKTWLLAASENNPGAVEIGQAAQNAARQAVQNFNNNWVELANGQSPIYQATVKVSLGLAAILIAVWAVPFFNTILQENFSDKTINSLFWPLTIILLLTLNNGLGLASFCLGLRNFTNSLNDRILEHTINGLEIGQIIKQANMNQAHEEIFVSKVQECRLLPTNGKSPEEVADLQDTCINSVLEEMQRLQGDQTNQAEGFKFDLKNLDIKKFITEQINSQIQRELVAIFSTLQTGFIFLVETASILNAYISPIFLALSLIPGQSSLMHAWLSGWGGLGLVKISYTIIVGITSSAIVSAKDTDLLLLPLLQGLLSPILALAIASGGGMALFNSLTSFTGGGARFLIRQASAVGGAGYSARGGAASRR